MSAAGGRGRGGRWARWRGPRWFAVVSGVQDGVREDRLTLVAAGVAFYATVSLVPALAALVSVYDIFADPAALGGQVAEVTRGLPPEVSDLIVDELTRLSASGRTSLGIGAVIATILALWSASAGVNALLEGLGVAFEQGASSSYIRKRGRALALTLGAVVFAAVAMGLVIAVPVYAERLAPGSSGGALLALLRWPVLAVLVCGALSFLYRTASRHGEERRWLTPGAVLGTALWLVASFGFSFYVTRFGRYAAYGSLGAVLVLLLWLWLSALTVLAGARFDVELDRVRARGANP